MLFKLLEYNETKLVLHYKNSKKFIVKHLCLLMFNDKLIIIISCSRQTILVKLDTQGASELLYNPGDHIAIYPENSSKLVDAILIRLHNSPPPDQLIKVEILNERTTPMGKPSLFILQN